MSKQQLQQLLKQELYCTTFFFFRTILVIYFSPCYTLLISCTIGIFRPYKTLIITNISNKFTVWIIILETGSFWINFLRTDEIWTGIARSCTNTIRIFCPHLIFCNMFLVVYYVMHSMFRNRLESDYYYKTPVCPKK